MAIDRNYVLNLMKSKNTSIEDFNYDQLICRPISSMFTLEDIYSLKSIATSLRYSANPKLKFEEIDKIMRRRGFVKLSAGTNRVVYRCIEDNSFVVKVAYDAVGMQDNPAEFRNQFLLKPFCTKVFEVAGDGVLATVERVKAITSAEEYRSIAKEVFTLIEEFIIGEYVVDDIGSQYFMNTGIRSGFGPVLLDFSFVFHLDGNKIFCKEKDPLSQTGCCEGEIDYDDGYNHLYCKKCGKRYRARELAKDIEKKSIVIKGGQKEMFVNISGGSFGKGKTYGSNGYNYIPTQATIPTQKIKVVIEKEPVKEEKVEVKNEQVIIKEPVKEEKKVEVKNEQVIEKEPVKEEKVEINNEQVVEKEPVKEEEKVEVKNEQAIIIKELTKEEKKLTTKNAISPLVFLDNKDKVNEFVEFLNNTKDITEEDITKLLSIIFTKFKNIISSEMISKMDEIVIENLDIKEEEIEDKTVTKEDTNDISFKYAEFFAAQIININELIPSESEQKVIVLKDRDNNYVTVDDNVILAISKIDDQDIDALSLVSTEYFDSILEENKELKKEYNEEDFYVEEIPTGVIAPGANLDIASEEEVITE